MVNDPTNLFVATRTCCLQRISGLGLELIVTGLVLPSNLCKQDI